MPWIQKFGLQIEARLYFYLFVLNKQIANFKIWSSTKR